METYPMNFMNNRPIMFKVWDCKLEKFRDGDLTIIESWLDSDSWDDAEELWSEPYHWQSIPTYNGRMIWLEYTGKNDVNGTLIFDGDILVRDDGKKFVVSWNSEEYGWYLYVGEPWFTEGYMEPYASLKLLDQNYGTFKVESDIHTEGYWNALKFD